ncbi:unnamed protein product [marine sediment metagenome]|uniref:HNH domain-containing protein n=1 Tax=marine sediment metagenome TaxID=412755 RepID=X0SXL8_9ZZZZ
MKQNELREWLVENQEDCPGCGKRVGPWDTLHHVFHRRLKQIDKLLWVPENCSLICPDCHPPAMSEAPNLNLNCALQKFSMGFEPDDIRDWLDSLPLKVKPGLPAFFLEAEEAFHGRDWRGQEIA